MDIHYIPPCDFDVDKVSSRDVDELLKVRLAMKADNFFVSFFHTTKSTMTVPGKLSSTEEEKFVWYLSTIQKGVSVSHGDPVSSQRAVSFPSTPTSFTPSPPKSTTSLPLVSLGIGAANPSSTHATPSRPILSFTDLRTQRNERNDRGREQALRDQERGPLQKAAKEPVRKVVREKDLQQGIDWGRERGTGREKERGAGREREKGAGLERERGKDLDGGRHVERGRDRERGRDIAQHRAETPRSKERGGDREQRHGRRERSYSSSRSPSPHRGRSERTAVPATRDARIGVVEARPTTKPMLKLDARTRCPVVQEWGVVQKRINMELKRFYPGWHLWDAITKDPETLLDCISAIRSGWANGDAIADRFLEKRMIKTMKQRRYYEKEKVRNNFNPSSNKYTLPDGMNEALFQAIVAELTAPEDTPEHRRAHRGDVGTHSTKRRTLTNAWGQGGYPRFHANFVRKWMRSPTEEEELYARNYSAKELKKKLIAQSKGLEYKCEKEMEEEKKRGEEMDAVGGGQTQTHVTHSATSAADLPLQQPVYPEDELEYGHDEDLVQSGGEDLNDPIDQFQELEDFPADNVPVVAFKDKGQKRKRSIKVKSGGGSSMRAVRDNTRKLTDTLRAKKMRHSEGMR